MTNEIFEQLLYEEESATLDFKKEQYRFVKSTDDEKSELLKDILGFANAWRRSEAYILIGVEDIRGGRGDVLGITAADHLDDHSLQQFVNNLTNQPVRFHYEAFGFDGKQVGIINIDEQTRPLYLKRDYGKLVREKVYVRRGSATDPTKPASLEEIAQMRIGSGQPSAELLVEFANVERDDALGISTAWEAEFCQMPSKEEIPGLRPPVGSSLSAIMFNPANRPNEDYFREMADFEFARRLYRPIRLVIRNIGSTPANNVRTELIVPTNIGVKVIELFSLPDPPKERLDFLGSSILHSIQPASQRRAPGEVRIDKNRERYRIEIDCGNLQPGRRVWSDIFYIGKKASGELPLQGLVLADNLPQPKGFILNVSIAVKKTVMTVEELCLL